MRQVSIYLLQLLVKKSVIWTGAFSVSVIGPTPINILKAFNVI